MEDNSITLRISFDKLQKCIDFQADKTVGKIMKRFEIIDNKDYLKKETKELIYEAHRDLRDLLVTVGMGLPIPKQWSINNKEDKRS